MLGTQHQFRAAAGRVALISAALVGGVLLLLPGPRPGLAAGTLEEGATCNATYATCPKGGGHPGTWEKITCHNPTTCADHYATCHSWDVCDCCSSVPLYKCLLPTAGKAYAPECSSPIDARQQCCGNAFTHERTTDVEEAIKQAIKDAETVVNASTASTRAEVAAELEELQAFVEKTGVEDKLKEAATSASEAASTASEAATVAASSAQETASKAYEAAKAFMEENHNPCADPNLAPKWCTEVPTPSPTPS